MTVNGDKGHRRTQAERSRATRAALLAAGRALFAAHGFAGAAREDIVERAGVTRGALYHHFASKEDLFRAVVIEMEEEVTQRVAEAGLRGTDPMDQFRRGCQAFLDQAMDPAVQRVLVVDAPSVLGWQAWRDIEGRYGLGLMREALAALAAGGLIEAQPTEPLAHMLLAALMEAALLIAGAAKPKKARREVGAAVDGLIARLARPAAPA